MDMKTQNSAERFWSRIPPWIFIGAVAVLLPILALITATNINLQRENSRRLLLGKGAALILSFEAGTRYGMMGMMGGSFQLQPLLEETASQPDIVYLVVTDADGIVQAHSDPERIGMHFGKGVDLAGAVSDGKLHWRQTVDARDQSVFEVYRLFRPAARHMGRGGMMGGRMGRYRQKWDDSSEPDRIIFVGLDMAQADATLRADMRHSIFMAVILLLVGLAGIVLLFTAQQYRAARKSLSRIRAFSDRLVDAMPVGLVSVNSDGRLAAINPEARRVLDLEETAAVGSAVEEALPLELRRIIQSADPFGERIEQEIDCCTGIGRNVPLGVFVSTWQDEAQGGAGRILLLRDLTEVHALRREIARSQRLASIGSLAAGVAHEIRNPLSSIKGFATYFQERYREVAADRETAAIMIQEVDRLNRVVGQLLELSRPVEIARQPIRIAELIARSLALVEARAREQGVRIRQEVPDPSPEIRLDTDRIQQVLLNLYLNAMEAMEDGGTLSVSVHSGSGGYLAIRVTDSGRGIDAEKQSQIFDPYFTTKSAGTGLGLAIVHNIMEAHQGKISVESPPGGGTVMTLLLPVEMGDGK